MATLAQFSRNIRSLKSRVVNNSTALTKKMARRSLKALIDGTPVDKGVARSNWRVGIGASTRSVIGAYTPYPKGSKGGGQGRGETANASAAYAAGSARINSVRGVPGVGLRTAIIITNNVPYIEQLDAKHNFVQPAIQASRSALAGFRLFARNPDNGE